MPPVLDFCPLTESNLGFVDALRPYLSPFRVVFTVDDAICAKEIDILLPVNSPILD